MHHIYKTGNEYLVKHYPKLEYCITGNFCLEKNLALLYIHCSHGQTRWSFDSANILSSLNYNMGKMYFCNARVDRLGKICPASKTLGCKVYGHNPLYIHKSWGCKFTTCQSGKRKLGSWLLLLCFSITAKAVGSPCNSTSLVQCNCDNQGSTCTLTRMSKLL